MNIVDKMLMNKLCAGCAFRVNSSNPVGYSYIAENGTVSPQWFVNATGPYDSAWDVFTKFNWDNGNNQTSAVKTRIVKYLWWENGVYDQNLLNLK